MTPQDQLPMALRTAYLGLHRRSDACFAKQGVTADQFVLLATLSHGEALTQRELAQRMPSDPNTVRAMLVLLEAQGLVERAAHPTDARARMVALSTAGKRMFSKVRRAGEPIRAQMFEALGPRNAALLVKLLRRVTESLASESVTPRKSAKHSTKRSSSNSSP